MAGKKCSLGMHLGVGRGGKGRKSHSAGQFMSLQVCHSQVMWDIS